MNDDAFLLRAHLPGDIGWIIHRHGALYAQEYGWNTHFEALVAEVAADFLKNHDPERERCWIAECDGRIAGSIFLMRGEGSTAKLRLLYVEPWARGRGIGQRLVDECLRAARDCGYTAITLWTTHNLTSARRIYEASGFALEKEEAFDTFGPPLSGQTWRLAFES